MKTSTDYYTKDIKYSNTKVKYNISNKIGSNSIEKQNNESTDDEKSDQK